jgi:hypothetical protein
LSLTEIELSPVSFVQKKARSRRGRRRSSLGAGRARIRRSLLFLVVFSRVFSIIRGEEQIFVSAQRADESETEHFQVIAGLYFGFIIANYV